MTKDGLWFPRTADIPVRKPNGADRDVRGTNPLVKPFDMPLMSIITPQAVQ